MSPIIFSCCHWYNGSPLKDFFSPFFFSLSHVHFFLVSFTPLWLSPFPDYSFLFSKPISSRDFPPPFHFSSNRGSCPLYEAKALSDEFPGTQGETVSFPFLKKKVFLRRARFFFPPPDGPDVSFLLLWDVLFSFLLLFIPSDEQKPQPQTTFSSRNIYSRPFLLFTAACNLISGSGNDRHVYLEIPDSKLKLTRTLLFRLPFFPDLKPRNPCAGEAPVSYLPPVTRRRIRFLPIMSYPVPQFFWAAGAWGILTPLRSDISKLTAFRVSLHPLFCRLHPPANLQIHPHPQVRCLLCPSPP